MRVSLRTKMLFMSFIVVSLSVLTSGWIMIYSITGAFEKELGERAIAIARTVAQMPDVRNHVGHPGGEKVIQPIAERIRLATSVDYIVIFDMSRIRYSHPSESYIGSTFEGGDERAALSEHEYVSKAYGALGYAVRAFVPIMDDEGIVQVGVAVVGILTPTFQSLLAQYRFDILLSLLWGLIIGLLGSLLLAHNIKKQTLNLEPYEIAKMVEERSAVMQAMDMGIIALDDAGSVTFMNRLAQEYTRVSVPENESTALHLRHIIPYSWENWHNQLRSQNKQPILNRNIVLHEKTYLLSLYPIHVKGQLVGSFMTITDRIEANRIAEELTGVKALVDALRAQNHEYLNKLHSIAGLIQLDRTEAALEVIIEETTDEEDVVQFLKDNIVDYSVSGLLIGKRSRARELGVQFRINRQSYLHHIVEGFSAGDIVTIIGNLVENAFESFAGEQKEKIVDCLLQGDERSLFIQVTDRGHGIPKGDQRKIFTYGYSTKRKDGRGIGLALVKQIVDAHQGTILIQSTMNEGTDIKIEVQK